MATVMATVTAVKIDAMKAMLGRFDRMPSQRGSTEPRRRHRDDAPGRRLVGSAGMPPTTTRRGLGADGPIVVVLLAATVVLGRARRSGCRIGEQQSVRGHAQTPNSGSANSEGAAGPGRGSLYRCPGISQNSRRRHCARRLDAPKLVTASSALTGAPPPCPANAGGSEDPAGHRRCAVPSSSGVLDAGRRHRLGWSAATVALRNRVVTQPWRAARCRPGPGRR